MNDLKAALAEVIDSPEGREQIKNLIREALNATKEVAVDCEFKCKSCGKVQRPRIKVPFRDWNAVKQFLELAISYVHGKAPTADKPKEKPRVTGRYEDLTDEQLMALLEEDNGEADGEAAQEAAS